MRVGRDTTLNHHTDKVTHLKKEIAYHRDRLRIEGRESVTKEGVGVEMELVVMGSVYWWRDGCCKIV